MRCSRCTFQMFQMFQTFLMFQCSIPCFRRCRTSGSKHKSLSIRENIVTFKALTANSPNYLTEMFNFCSNETYNLRSNFCQLFLEKPQIFSKKVSHIERQNLGTISRITLDKTSTISHSMLLNLCSSITTEPIKSPGVN